MKILASLRKIGTTEEVRNLEVWLLCATREAALCFPGIVCGCSVGGVVVCGSAGDRSLAEGRAAR